MLMVLGPRLDYRPNSASTRPTCWDGDRVGGRAWVLGVLFGRRGRGSRTLCPALFDVERGDRLE